VYHHEDPVRVLERILIEAAALDELPARAEKKSYYPNPDWLIIDEFGFDKIERAESPERRIYSVR
jgi:hypothetical protein